MTLFCAGPCDRCRLEFPNRALALVGHEWMCKRCELLAQAAHPKQSPPVWAPVRKRPRGAIATHWREYEYPDGIGGVARAEVAIDQYANMRGDRSLFQARARHINGAGEWRWLGRFLSFDGAKGAADKYGRDLSAGNV